MLVAKFHNKKQIESLIKSQEKARKILDETIFTARSDNGDIIGFSSFINLPYTVEITGLYVHPDYIRRGIGTQLLQRIEAAAFEKKHKNIHVISSLAALDFYKANGYSLVRRTTFDLPWSRIPCELLQKDLVPPSLADQFWRHVSTVATYVFLFALVSTPLWSIYEYYIRPNESVGFPSKASHLRDRFEATRLSFVGIRVTAESNTEILTSKFLGKPYWPSSIPYPTDREGSEMTLLAQINFEEVPILQGFPTQGILQFFISPTESRDHIWGMSIEGYRNESIDLDAYINGLQKQDFFRVIYHEPPYDEDDLRQDFPHVALFALPVDREAWLSFSSESEVVTPSDYRFEQIFGQTLWDLADGLGTEVSYQLVQYLTSEQTIVDAKIGGYANLVQDDPRALQPDEDWVVLLWTDSFMFSIRRSDLRQLDFSRVLYFWHN